MGPSGKDISKIVTTVYIVVSFLCAPARATESIPSADDINDLADAATFTVEKFMQESFEPRFRYECSGRFLSKKDRENLYRLAKTATDRLQQITESQKKLNRRIEDYEGDDWEARYGSTGLWRRLQRDRYVTSLSKCEIDYYLALSAQPPKRNAILRETLNEIDSMARIHNTHYVQLIKAKSHALLAKTEPTHRLMVKEQFNRLMYSSDVDEATALRTTIEKIKFLVPTSPDELDNLAKAIVKSRSSDDIELILSLALLQRRYNAEALRETLTSYPQIEGFLGDCILSDLSAQTEQGQLDVKKISVLEAELAAQAAWKENTQEYTRLLNRLANNKKHQTPLVLYVTAVACADSSPTKAVDLLIKASRLQQAQESDRLAIEAVEVARQAAQLAYTLFTQTLQDCPLVLDAFDNYRLIAGEDVNEQLEYLDAVVLNSCGRAQKSKELLTKIAARPAGKWQKRARLDLIKLATRQKHDATEQQHAILLDQLGSLIADSTGNENEHHVRIEAILLYCGLLLESQDQSSAQKVLDAVAEVDEIQDPNLAILKSIALRRMGRLNESARCLARALDTGRCDHVTKAMELLSEVVDEIDRFQSSDLTFFDDCERLARLSHRCLEGQARQKAAFFLLEISTYSAKKPEEGLSALQKLLDHMAAEGLGDTLDFIRCRARLSARQGKFEEAAKLWRQVAEMRSSDSASHGEPSWKWWRARYYELLCRSKSPQTNKESLVHTIDVLQNSFMTIPPLWAEKIRSLR